ncbi:hypothetical protein ACHAXT_000207 [Thalassiosira profunda]
MVLFDSDRRRKAAAGGAVHDRPSARKLFATLRQKARGDVSGSLGSEVPRKNHKLPQVSYEGDRTHSRTTTRTGSIRSGVSIASSQLFTDASVGTERSEPPSPPRSRSNERRQTKERPRPALEEEYRVSRRAAPLGHGIAGQVREGIHLATGSPCAIKTMHKAQIRRKDRIHREISFLKRCAHPNIVELYDVYETEEEVHIVTELCQGGELFDRIVQKATASKEQRRRWAADGDEDNLSPDEPLLPACFPERDAARIVRSLLSAVAYLHSHNCVHRDLKPENILFSEADDDDQSEVKLIDFGLSIRHDPEDPPLRSTVGTSYYMSPELLDGNYDRACDLWSVGVITYVMLSGRPPFNGSTDEVIFEKIKRGRYRMEGPLWDDGLISDAAKDFVKCLLDVDPMRRWTADMALEHEWLQGAR